MGLTHRSSLVSPRQSFSLSFSLLFFRLIPWNMEAPCVHLSAQVSKTWMGRRSASSLPRETGRAPVASMNRANALSWSFIGFLRKPRNISLFLSSIFLSTIFFPYLSKSSTDAVFPSGSPGSCGGWTPAIFLQIPSEFCHDICHIL